VSKNVLFPVDPILFQKIKPKFDSWPMYTMKQNWTPEPGHFWTK